MYELSINLLVKYSGPSNLSYYILWLRTQLNTSLSINLVIKNSMWSYFLILCLWISVQTNTYVFLNVLNCEGWNRSSNRSTSTNCISYLNLIFSIYIYTCRNILNIMLPMWFCSEHWKIVQEKIWYLLTLSKQIYPVSPIKMLYFILILTEN